MKRKILQLLILALCIFFVQSDSVYAYNEPVSGDEEEQEPGYDPYEERNGQIFYRYTPEAELDLVQINSLTDEQKLQRLMEIDTKWEFDADLMDWWIAFPCDEQMKYNYFITRKAEVFSATVCNWVINNDNFTMEQKVAYIRSRDFWYSSMANKHMWNVFDWWYVNVGEPLSSYETTKIDTGNYIRYIESVNYRKTNSFYSVGLYESASSIDNTKLFSMLMSDFRQAQAEGLIQTDTIRLYIDDKPSSIRDYTTSCYDTIAQKYKIWNWK